MMNSVKSLESKPKIEEILFSMISTGSIRAKIDPKQEMISFIDTTSAQGGKDESKDQEYIEVIEELEKQNARIIALMS